MNFQSLQSEISRLATAMQTLAAIGAAMRLRQSGDRSDSVMCEAVDTFLKKAVPGGLGDLDDLQSVMLLNMTDYLVEESAELLRNPSASPTWSVTDSRLLQAQGRLSRYGFRAIEALSASRPNMQKALQGRFLDVGTGVGGFVLEAVQRCSSLRAVGIDIWDPALALARANVAVSPHPDRIEIRRLDVRELEEVDAYDLIWLPTPYMSRETVEVALGRLNSALTAGGYLILGYQTLPADPIAAAFVHLRTARSGGYLWAGQDLEHQLQTRGFVDVESSTPFPEANFIIGRRI